jgi:hypothetical protein
MSLAFLFGVESNIAPNHLSDQQLRKLAKDSNCWATVEELCNGWEGGIRARSRQARSARRGLPEAVSEQPTERLKGVSLAGC